MVISFTEKQSEKISKAKAIDVAKPELVTAFRVGALQYLKCPSYSLQLGRKNYLPRRRSRAKERSIVKLSEFGIVLCRCVLLCRFSFWKVPAIAGFRFH